MLIGQVQGLLDRLVRTAGFGPGIGGDGGGVPARERSRPTGESTVTTTEEEIRRVVAENGGRIEQGEVVSSLECSAATVSRRLGDLEDEGEVVRYRVGRRKIVCLPGHANTPGIVGRDAGPSTGERLSS